MFTFVCLSVQIFVQRDKLKLFISVIKHYTFTTNHIKGRGCGGHNNFCCDLILERPTHPNPEMFPKVCIFEKHFLLTELGDLPGWLPGRSLKDPNSLKQPFPPYIGCSALLSWYGCGLVLHPTLAAASSCPSVAVLCSLRWLQLLAALAWLCFVH